MEREEAKEFLINISYKLGNMSVEYLTEKDGEKMREAIEVLEQELCEDAISRSNLISKLDICYKEKIRVAPDNMAEGFMQVDKLIKQEPPVIPTQKWIPVSERLPEDNTRVLVTVKVGNREPKVRSGYYYMDGHFHIDNGDCWKSGDKELLAWMPLHEPYRKENHG